MDKVRFNIIKTISKEYDTTLIFPFKGELNTDHISILNEICNQQVVPVQISKKPNNIKRKLRSYYNLIIKKIPFYIFDNDSQEFNEILYQFIKERQFDYIQIYLIQI